MTGKFNSLENVQDDQKYWYILNCSQLHPNAYPMWSATQPL